MVVVVFEDEVTAAYPTDVEVTEAADLKYSGAANVPTVILLFNFKDDIPVAVYDARQCPIALNVPG